MLPKGMIRLVVLLSVLLFGYPIFAQETEVKVEISTQKVSLKGKEYYMHTVQKGQTVYAISKAYNVLQKDIAMENPEVFDGLKEGQVIKIPVLADEDKTKETDKYIYHTVGQGETVYYLTRKYGIRDKDLFKYNPDAEKGLQAGQVIKIPRKKAEEISPVPEEDEYYKYHMVDKGQTLYSLAKTYEVSQEAILMANPDISVSGLKYEMIIRIPKKGVIKPEVVSVLDTVKPDTVIQVIVEPENPCMFNYRETPVTFRIALMLPFYQDGIIIADEAEKTEITDIRQKPFLEFYEGVLLAVEDMQQAGLNVELFVYDTKKDSASVLEIIRKEEFSTMDLIIGPVYSEVFPLVADFAMKNKIFIVSPLSNNIEMVNGNPYAILSSPSFETQLSEAVKFLAQSGKTNFIIVHSNTEEEQKIVSEYKVLLVDELLDNGKNDKVAIKEVNFRAGGVNSMVQHMLKDTGNVVIIPSHDQAFVSDAVTRIYIRFHKDYDITLAGFPVWRKFENIPLEYFHEMDLHTFYDKFVDYERSDVRLFVSRYRKYYEGEPSSYSFSGYDVTYFFLTAMMKYGSDFCPCLDSLHLSLFQSDFNFRRISETGGYENSANFILKYDKEYNVRKVTVEDLLNEDRDKEGEE